MRSNNFDRVARFYDTLASLLFSDLQRSQSYFLPVINATSSVLIVGGGTGQLLKQLPKGVRVTYLDLSEKMMQLARKQTKEASLSVDFRHGDFLSATFSYQYDVVIMPFFLDCFHEGHLDIALKKTHDLLKNNGQLIVTDFQRKRGREPLLKIMHWFFGWVAGLESKSLQNIHQKVLLNGFQVHQEHFFQKGFIFSRVYRKYAFSKGD